MPRKLLAAAAILIVAGLAAWLWWSRDRTRVAEAPTVAAPKPAAVPGRAPPPARDDGPIGPQVMIDDDPKGTLRLEGQVIDRDEHPVAGATVVLDAHPPRTATTETDGSFAFEGLVGRPYTLIARGAGGAAGPVTARLTERSEPVILKLRAAGKLTVEVVGSDGKPVDGATVELRGIDDRRATVKGKTAVFELVVPGAYQIAAWADGMARTFQWTQIAAGDSDAKLVLRAGAPVRGRVVDDRGTGVANARVRYSGASDWSQQSSDRHDAAVTAADGTFAFDALPPGSFRFIANHPERAPGASAIVTLDGKSAREGIVITLGAGATVSGRVVDSQGNKVASARVRIGEVTSPRTMRFDPPRQAYTNAEGVFEIKGLAKKPLQAVALHETGSSQTATVDASGGDVRDVTLTIDLNGTIAGTVVDPTGQPIEGAQVTAGPNFRDNRTPIDFSQWRLRGFPEELTDAAGKFTLTGLAPGQYQITAVPAQSGGRGRFRDGVTASPGDTNVKIVLSPEGAVRGRVAFADGTAPAMFTVGVQMGQQAFGTGDGAFTLDGLAPQTYELTVRGPSFQTRAFEVTVEPGKTADAGTITVVKGRSIAGTVVADGQPVAGATVFAGRVVFGNGTSNAAPFNPMSQGTKQDTTDANGAFSLSGFNEGDITIVAEQDQIGRSKALRLPTVMPGQTELVLQLEKFGSLSGIVRQGGKPIEGTFVTCQSTTTPGALYSVASGPDGSYRFDRLAPDVYKVSAMLGMPMTGMRFYSKQIEVPSGKQVTLDLAVEPGTITLDVTLAGRNAKVGVAQTWLASVPVTAHTLNELSLELAAAGPSASQLVIVRNGEPARFADISAGAYTVCAVPYPAEVKGMAAMGYAERHADSMLAFCKPLTVAQSPASQAAQVEVDLPPFVPDSTGSGSGSGH